MANVLNALPKSAQPTARRMLAGIRDAEDHNHALRAVDAFAGEFGAEGSGQDRRRRRGAAGVLPLPRRALIHFKTSNPIESTFSTVRLRTRVT